MREEYIFLGIAAVAFIFVWWFVRQSKKDLRMRGMQAYWDGLPRNPAWGKEILEGWDYAKYLEGLLRQVSQS